MQQLKEHPGVIRTLRRLVPHRPLRFNEALRVAELQANRCRELLGLDEPALPEAAITELPRIAVSYEPLPVSGLAQWHNGRWLIALNRDEPETRQRFSLAHELFHIINHTTKDWLHPDDELMGSATKVEKLADYFAGCLLMPKRHVKALVGRGYQAQSLADSFEVSLRAITVRLAQLGLSDSLPRCVRPVNRWDRVMPPYRRVRSDEPRRQAA
jgi:predicted transcriptional regulator